jgi:hypothetical protein
MPVLLAIALPTTPEKDHSFPQSRATQRRSQTMRSVFVLVLMLCFCPLAGAQNTGHRRAKAAAEQPATIVPGIGGIHHPVSTSNPEAQKLPCYAVSEGAIE